MAEYGQSGTHVLQPEHSSSVMYAVLGSISTYPVSIKTNASAAAEPACPTESGISLGAWHAPAIKMPSVKVFTGASFGWRSRNQPSVEQLMLKSRLTSLASSWGTSPTESTTISTGTRRTKEMSVSSA